MDAVIKELPLALFTTIASVGIGAFVAMFCAIYVNKSMGAGSLKRLDKLTAVPIVFCVVALICAFFHLGDPLHAVNIVNTIGSSPMTNEIVAFCVFLVARRRLLARRARGQAGKARPARGVLGRGGTRRPRLVHHDGPCLRAARHPHLEQPLGNRAGARRNAAGWHLAGWHNPQHVGQGNAPRRRG